jgi:hypothetical protein
LKKPIGITLKQSTECSDFVENTALKAVKETGSSDVVTSRALAIAHTGIFDAWAA